MSKFVESSLSALKLTVAMLISLAIPVVLVRVGLVPLLETGLSLQEETVTIVRRVGVLCALVGGFWAYVSIFEKRTPNELSIKPGLIALSGMLGAVTMGLPLLVLYAMGVFASTSSVSSTAWITIGFVIFAVAFLEEIVFRGIVFRVILKKSGLISALLLPSLLFSVLHLFNANWSGGVSILSGALLGVLWSLVYLYSQNIWAVTLHHAAWNFTIFSTGLPLTGTMEWRSAAPIQSELVGPDLWTGGVAGPENSVLVIACIILAIAGTLWACRIRGRWQLP